MLDKTFEENMFEDKNRRISDTGGGYKPLRGIIDTKVISEYKKKRLAN